MSTFSHFKLLGSVLRMASLLAAAVLLPSMANGQSSDTVTISGTFQMLSAEGILSPDLAGVFARRMDHTWTLTMHGVTYEHDYIYEEWGDPQTGIGFDERYITRVHPTAFTLEFFGPDAAILNAAVSSQLARGGLINGATVGLINEGIYDPLHPEDSGTYFSCYVHLLPLDPANGVAFSSYAYDWQSIDNYIPAYPDFTPRQLWVEDEAIDDYRTPYSGSINSWGQLMNVGSSNPPTIPPGLSIFDGSVVEGHSGTRRLDLTVTLSGTSSQQITVQYRTVNGTAAATSDYKAASGTVTFLPGETRKTISISVVGDRKREANETFTVDLSNPSGAYFFDSAATATIINDD